MKYLLLLTIALGTINISYSQKVFKGKNGKRGVKSRDGEVLVEPIYDYAERIKIAIPLGLDAYHPEIQEDISKVYISVMNDGKFGIINSMGEIILPLKNQSISSEMSLDSIIIFNPEQGQWSFMDFKDRKIYSTEFQQIKTFHEGLAVAEVSDYKVGFINTKGEMVIPAKYTASEGFSEGIAQVQVGNKQGYIDSTGKPLTLLEYDKAKHYSNGIGAVNEGGKWEPDFLLFVGGKWGLLDQKGKPITTIKYDQIGHYLGNNHIAVNIGAQFNNETKRISGGKWAVLNTQTGNEITGFKFDDIRSFGDKMPLVYQVMLENKYGLIDLNGNEVFPIEWDYIGSYKDGYFLAKKEGKNYHINEKGEVKEIKKP